MSHLRAAACTYPCTHVLCVKSLKCKKTNALKFDIIRFPIQIQNTRAFKSQKMQHFNNPYRLILISLALITLASNIVDSSPFTCDSNCSVARLSSSISLSTPSSKLDQNDLGNDQGRFLMARIRWFISYVAMRRNSIPCEPRSASYYNFNAR